MWAGGAFLPIEGRGVFLRPGDLWLANVNGALTRGVPFCPWSCGTFIVLSLPPFLVANPFGGPWGSLGVLGGPWGPLGALGSRCFQDCKVPFWPRGFGPFLWPSFRMRSDPRNKVSDNGPLCVRPPWSHGLKSTAL